MNLRRSSSPAVFGASATTLLALVLAATPAHADEAEAKKEAQALFGQGVKLVESGDLRGALNAFRGAHDKFPNFRVLYNIGQLCVKLDDPACAHRAYDQYLREGSSSVPAKRRTEVEKELASLTKKVGLVTISVNAASADVTVDDVPVGKFPLPGPVAMSPGSHNVVASTDGRNGERSVTATAGQAASVDIEIPPKETKPVAPPPVTSEPTTPVEEKPKPQTTENSTPVVPWVITGVLAAGTIVSGILAATSYSAYQDKKNQFPVEPAELEDSQGTARTFFLMTGIFGALTVVSAGVASYFTFIAPSGKSTATVGLGFAPNGVMLRGSL